MFFYRRGRRGFAEARGGRENDFGYAGITHPLPLSRGEFNYFNFVSRLVVNLGSFFTAEVAEVSRKRAEEERMILVMQGKKSPIPLFERDCAPSRRGLLPFRDEAFSRGILVAGGGYDNHGSQFDFAHCDDTLTMTRYKDFYGGMIVVMQGLYTHSSKCNQIKKIIKNRFPLLRGDKGVCELSQNERY